MMTELNSIIFEEMPKVLADAGIEGIPAYRVKQIYEWLHSKTVASFDEMNNLPKQLRQLLNERFSLAALESRKVLCSEQDKTIKYLFMTKNDNIILESVYMSNDYGSTACISSQAGCRMGCSFCASALHGLERNLTAGEMLAQVYEIQRNTGIKISHIVIMGIGEPLDNFDEVIRFIGIINSKFGQNISQRRITLSTCGIIDGIYALAGEELQITLAVSLHAPNDEIRRKIMPVAKRFPLDELMAACRFYTERTGRRISFEYALMDGVNDSPECAKELAALVKGGLYHVNLIPVNEIRERSYKKSSQQSVNAFLNQLLSVGVEATVRRRLGMDIDAACGQLRLNVL